MTALVALAIFVAAWLTPMAPARAVTCSRVVAGHQYANVNTVSPYEVLTSVTSTCRSDAPALITIHGGAWMTGVRADINDAVEAFYSRGWQVFNVEYRHAYSTPWGQQLRDVQAAYQWVVRHAATYGVDVHRISTLGFSAGGHMAAWLGQTEPVASVVSLSGVLQPRQVAEYASGRYGQPTAQEHTLNWREVARTGCELQVATTACKAGWDRFDPGTAIGPNTPPTYVVQGMSDPTVPPRTADDYAALLTQHGVPHVLVTVPGYAHVDGTLFDGSAASNARLQATASWMSRQRR
jgi:acetyl esterase/lipase